MSVFLWKLWRFDSVVSSSSSIFGQFNFGGTFGGTTVSESQSGGGSEVIRIDYWRFES